jgi:hypothetical protein
MGVYSDTSEDAADASLSFALHEAVDQSVSCGSVRNVYTYGNYILSASITVTIIIPSVIYKVMMSFLQIRNYPFKA